MLEAGIPLKEWNRKSQRHLFVSGDDWGLFYAKKTYLQRRRNL